ncbi:hypothetical protein [Pseudomonas citronellolis]|uniref:hypothetical protein n=1 Tax=Pseudomonas citronellolis TaxID=53408 RepID=UPI0023E41CB9|nr:hypothetical protein [Pseudomonas citronellolis]MDF3931873.1 hypothetical protein [Pseudomonas citronellolis]
MRRGYLVALLLLGLAGCQSPGQLKEEAPAQRLQTLKSPPVYRDCLAPKWAGAAQREIRFGYRLVLPEGQGGEPASLLEVTANERGSLVALYQRPGVEGDAAERAARECL